MLKRNKKQKDSGIETYKLCALRHNMPRPSPPLRGLPSASPAAEQTERSSTFPSRIRSHTLTAAAALRVKAALSKVAW